MAENDPDADLMLRVQRGDVAAFESIVAKYQQPIANVVYRVLHDATEAEDLTQKVFIQVYKSAHRYKPTARFSTWIFTIARNVFRDQQRSAIRRPQPASLDVVGPVPIDPMQHLSRSVAEALQHLGEVEREAFLLREVSGMSYREIAAILQTSPDAVRNRIHRARCSLRELLSSTLGNVRPRVLKEARS